MKITLTALKIAATLFAVSASAFDFDQLQKFMDSTYCTNCDLSGVDLYGANLSGANLDETYLSRANLMGANLFVLI